MSTTCSECGRTPAPHDTVTGRQLCDSCFRRLAELAGAASAMGEGQGAPSAIAQGIATGGFTGMVGGVAAESAAHHSRLNRTKGFWKRLWVRVVG